MIQNPTLPQYYKQHHRPHAWRWWREDRPGGPPWRLLGWVERQVVRLRYWQKRLNRWFPFDVEKKA